MLSRERYMEEETLIIERNTANCHIYCKNVVEFKNNSVSLRRKRY